MKNMRFLLLMAGVVAASQGSTVLAQGYPQHQPSTSTQYNWGADQYTYSGSHNSNQNSYSSGRSQSYYTAATNSTQTNSGNSRYTDSYRYEQLAQDWGNAGGSSGSAFMADRARQGTGWRAWAWGFGSMILRMLRG